ncbi:DUF4192 family protein [Devriesea agamarum]|uniref:DUF4192 family protein n=1 Tax=Devriesea agamarum TaxID=472569 RepID=UPI00155E385C|nr:DUF4192 family protein [Devriesea agamarum]
MDTAPFRTSGSSLAAHDPSELLAYAVLACGSVPVNSLILIGYIDRREAVMVLRVHLGDLPNEDASLDSLQHALTDVADALRHRGCTGALMLMIGSAPYGNATAVEPNDESLEPLAEAIADLAVRAVPLIQAFWQGMGVDIPTCWCIESGRILSVSSDGSLSLKPARALIPWMDTRYAAATVARGIPLPPLRLTDPYIPSEQHRRIQHLVYAEEAPGCTLEPRRAWERFVTARRTVGSQWPPATDTETTDSTMDTEAPMAMCERIRTLMTSIIETSARDDLIAYFVQLSAMTPLTESDAIKGLVRDPMLHPHPYLCAGGSWDDDLAALVAIGVPSPEITPHQAGHTLVGGWAQAAAVHALLAWWDARLATASQRALKVLTHVPGHPLARLVLQLTETGLLPAWAEHLMSPTCRRSALL